MRYERIRIEPIAGALGAEVSGLRLAEPLDNQTEREIHQAWMEHQVLFFRDQQITPEQQIAFGRCFGELHVHPVLPSLRSHPEIVVLESDAHHPYVAEAWHSDATFQRRPPLGSILRGVIIPDYGGDTMWSSMHAAYDALSGSMQQLLSGLRGVHDGGAFRALASDEQKDKLAEDEKTAHPLIRTHPITGRKSLFVNAGFTTSIEGMKTRESAALLSFLFEHVTSPEFTCRFRWRPNSIAMWDNRNTQHRVIPDNLRAHRRMERVTICGEVPF